MTLRLILFLLLAAAPGAGALAQPPSPRLSDPAGQLVFASSQIRFAFAGSSETALRSLSAAEARILTDRLGLAQPGARGAWESVIGASTQFLRRNGDGAESLWWNPAIDAGVALRWRRGADGWRIVDAAAYLGDTLRGTPLVLGADPMGNMRRAAVATRSAFRAGGAARFFGANLSQRPIFERVAASRRSFLATLNGVTPVAERLTAAEQLLIRESIPPPPGLLRYLRAMPGEARAMLAPQRRFIDASGESVIWSSPGAPDTLLILQYPNDPTALAPRMILAVNLIVREGEQP